MVTSYAGSSGVSGTGEIAGTSVYSSGPIAGASLTLSGGSLNQAVSAAAAATGASGTIATAGLGISRILPAAARTACVLQAGTFDGQTVTVQNEAIASRSITFDVAATSNVADGAGVPIPGLTSRTFTWSAQTALWTGQIPGALLNQALTVSTGGAAITGTLAVTGGVTATTSIAATTTITAGTGLTVTSGGQTITAGGQTITAGVVKTSVIPASGVSTTIANGNTITPTAEIMRFTNGGAVTGVLMAAGTDGQRVTIVNEGSGSITFAAVGTSLVANGVTTVITTLTARTLVYCANVVVPAWYTCSAS